MQHDGINAVADGLAVESVAPHQPQDPAHFGLVVLDFRRGRGTPYRRSAAGGARCALRDDGSIEYRDQFAYAGCFDADGFETNLVVFAHPPGLRAFDRISVRSTR